ncbi:MAG: hypothetical protein ABI867_08765 [Kofleriaceae bacterium]
MINRWVVATCLGALSLEVAADSPSAAPSVPVPSRSQTCALDASWLGPLGIAPRVSRLSRFPAMRQRDGFGAGTAQRTFNEFDRVRRSAEEKYEWRVPAQSAFDRDLQMIVLRDADGPIPPSYGPGRVLPGGVVEHPGVSRSFLKNTFTLFVFPDHTWARMEGDATAQFRTLHAMTTTPPPAPAVPGDVAWEVCGDLDPNDLSLPYAVWSIGEHRVSARLFASRLEGELAYRFGSPASARRAATDQQARCQGGRCPWVLETFVDGPVVRYRTTIAAAPTSTYAVLKIAAPTKPLAAPPAALTPGSPVSGVYQQFVEVTRDTCPTHAIGQRFPSMMELVLVTHKRGDAVATLAASSPQARGILSADPIADIPLVAGASAEKTVKHLCPNHAIHWNTTVVAVGADGITVRSSIDHTGSTAGCSHSNLPSNCVQETVTAWSLARTSCAAACDASYGGGFSYTEGEPAPRVDVTCSCP